MNRRYHPKEGLWEDVQGLFGLALIYVTGIIVLLAMGVVVAYVGMIIVDIVSGWPRP